MSSKEIILNKIREALQNKDKSGMVEPDLSASVYQPLLLPLELQFQKSLEAIKGKVFLCKSENEVLQALKELCQEKKWSSLYCLDATLKTKLLSSGMQIKDAADDFKSMEAGVTGCEFLVAHTGSVLISSHGNSGRRMNVFPPNHIIFAKKHQLVDYLESAFDAIYQKYGSNIPSLISAITGPSRTADIEKTLVMGAHGPEGLFVFLDLEE
ncbi:MAG: lactate utilization protein [Bacteroidota bacterium]|nr:lactate utilization protein [Bacteroidota bacterium]MDP4207003.1 lactate utilization protein [Bacteroidota bacterium]